MSTDASLTAVLSDPPAAKPVLPDDPVILRGMIHELLDALQRQRRQMEQVQHRLSLILQRLYGPRKERINPDQLLLFAEAFAAVRLEEDASADVDEDEGEPIPAAGPKRRPHRHGRQELPKDLPRVPVIHDLTEAERACPDCGHERQKIGEETSAQLDYQPASIFVLDHTRYTYACPHCEGQVRTADKPPQPIDKGLPGPGLLAHVVTSKYADHLPLYRQERILERFGVTLSRSTLCDWMARAAGLLRPMYEGMVQAVLASRVVHTDDTPVAVQDPKLDKTRTGRLWVYLGDALHPYNVFDYTPSRRRDGPAEFLKAFGGHLQADAFSGYDGIYLTKPVIEVGCNAHARRKFFEAKGTDPARAHQALAFYRQLYEIERTASDSAEKEYSQRSPTEEVRHEDLLEAERLRWRQEKSVPLLTSMCQWLKEQQTLALPKSPIGQAIGYALNHWPALVRYTERGFLAIDNNWAEREMKRIAIGRKNWMFLGSDQGGHTAAVLFSLVSSSQRHGLDPFAYLADVFYRLPTQPKGQLDQLFPDRWKKAHASNGNGPPGPSAPRSPPPAATGPAP